MKLWAGKLSEYLPMWVGCRCAVDIVLWHQVMNCEFCWEKSARKECSWLIVSPNCFALNLQKDNAVESFERSGVLVCYKHIFGLSTYCLTWEKCVRDFWTIMYAIIYARNVLHGRKIFFSLCYTHSACSGILLKNISHSYCLLQKQFVHFRFKQWFSHLWK